MPCCSSKPREPKLTLIIAHSKLLKADVRECPRSYEGNEEVVDRIAWRAGRADRGRAVHRKTERVKPLFWEWLELCIGCLSFCYTMLKIPTVAQRSWLWSTPLHQIPWTAESWKMADNMIEVEPDKILQLLPTTTPTWPRPRPQTPATYLGLGDCVP